MGPSNSAPGEIVEHGPRTDLFVMLGLFPIVPAVLFGFLAVDGVLTGLLNRPGTIDRLWWSSLATIALILVTYAVITTDRVELDQAGIRAYRLWQPRGARRWLEPLIRWEWLDPTPRGALRLGFAEFRWHKPGGYLRWFRLSVSPHQAQRILAHPGCPKSPQAPSPEG